MQGRASTVARRRSPEVESFGIQRTLERSFDEVLTRVPEVLKAEGFGVLTEIDVKATLKKRLDLDFRRYRILGACNPPLAHQALQHSLDVGLLLPCNVIVYETDEGRTVVSAVDPMQTIAARGDAAIQPIAEQVRQKLKRVIDAI
jgi:uncharacterized protein (DUF302 family)